MTDSGKCYRRPPVKRGGFSLVELLVVIGIIVVLISILLPLLAKARRAALGSQCLSNMCQIGVAEAIYASENKGLMTYSLDPDIKNLINMNNNYYNFDVCPSLTQDGSTAAAGYALTSYGYNEWFSFMNNTGSGSTLPALQVRPSAVLDVAQTVVFADVVYITPAGISTTYSENAIADPFRISEQGNYTKTPMRPDFHGRHNGSGSVLWMDWHASLEQPTKVPDSAPIKPSNASAVQCPPSFYAYYHVGYLTPTGINWANMSPEYNFVFRKDLLSQNNVFLYNYVFLDPTAGKPAWQ